MTDENVTSVIEDGDKVDEKEQNATEKESKENQPNQPKQRSVSFNRDVHVKRFVSVSAFEQAFRPARVATPLARPDFHESQARRRRRGAPRVPLRAPRIINGFNCAGPYGTDGVNNGRNSYTINILIRAFCSVTSLSDPLKK
ncbi:hypothetical protein EVAR_42713_1 [Eumeta japonica]|uniref:Uncharacterized protein n=1 Tax=Eumeta variegata TaxID=151549 RepID=A0A4C1X2C0_EUMVA|nr:hypothetical protein EVAR_42713_1 [Eumeta japonica]